MLNAGNDLELMTEVAEWNSTRIANGHDILEMWQGSQNLHATQKQSCTQNTQITAIEYILNTEDIVKSSGSNFQHDGVAAFELSERPHVPPASFSTDLPAGRTQLSTIRWINKINCHLSARNEDSAPESISGNGNLLDCNVDLDSPNDCEDNWEADYESDIELDSGTEYPKP